ncbi:MULTISPECIES: dUTP diphosphatase [Nesterenkonia]|uniref:Deoxyuridine 5'-triphosphate nucleotidohydrolase n=3 Tax=Actinomycetes TaxID=1760 RepID=A0ABP6LQ84_9MICC
MTTSTKEHDAGQMPTGSAPGRIRVPIRRLDPDLPLPGYAHPGDAGADLVSAEDFTLEPGARRLVPTGVAVAIPQGWVGLVHPRSGLAVKHGITLVNTPGTIDAGYRGELKVCLLNTDRSTPVSFRRGDRIAQLVLQRVDQAEFVPVDQLEDSDRGAGGFGSTGT